MGIPFGESPPERHLMVGEDRQTFNPVASKSKAMLRWFFGILAAHQARRTPHMSPSVPLSTVSSTSSAPLVGVVMGSRSDWETMRHAVEMLERLGVPHEVQVVSAHRTPDLLFRYAENAERRKLQVIIAGAGGAAHLPGMLAAKTIVPVLGVPVQSHALSGMDSLLSIAQMPSGIPVGTLAIGKAGAANAALLAAAIVGISRPDIRTALHDFRRDQTDAVLAHLDPRPGTVPGAVAGPGSTGRKSNADS